MSTFDDKKPSAGTAEPNTIYRDKAPGKSAKANADSAVNAALGTSGSGTQHSSGATFHNDSTSHAAADALGARAFTAGSDVHFGSGQYNPGTPAGDTLINHELTHVQQSRGVEPPKPGNFRVSSPSDSAEVAAREGSGGAAGSASTIYRDGDDPPATEGSGPSAPSGGESAGGDSSGGTTTADPYETWKAAVQAWDATAVAKWEAVPSKDKNKVKTEGEPFWVRMMHTMHASCVKVIKESGLEVQKFNYYFLLQDDFATYLTPLRTHNLLNRWLDAEPQKHIVQPRHLTKLQEWMTATTNRTEAKRIFEKAYPTLHDTAPGPVSFSGVVAVWPIARINALFSTLATYLDTGHAATITGGFVYVTSPGFGWWSPGQRRVFLPASSTTSSGHGMSGGTAQGHKSGDPVNNKGNVTAPTGRSVNPNFTGADGKAVTGANARMAHFTTTILHEVGHGVGARLDGGRGNAYAENSGSWPGFNINMNFDTWANELWYNGATGSGTAPAVHRNAKLDDSHAKDFLKAELQGNNYSPGWVNNPPRNDMARYVKWKYAAVPLTKWWVYFKEQNHAKGPSYMWDEPSARIRNNWCYSYLTRGGSNWTKYKAHTFNQKVSWYSLSSPREWFAEQYTHYYRTQKTGNGLDSATAKLLKELDDKDFVATNSSGSEGVSIGGESTGGDSEGGGGVAQAGGATAADTSPAGAEGGEQQQQDDARPLMFPW